MTKLKPEDYLEPECVLCEKPIGFKQNRQMIPQKRISAKLDDLMAHQEYRQAEDLLQYWQGEARLNGDRQGEFMLCNEMMGFYRKIGEKEKSYQAVEKALVMLDELGYRNSVSGAIAYTNIATVYVNFEEAEKALPYFEKARDIYQLNASGTEFKIASLHNNMATALVSLERYDEAEKLFLQAIDILNDYGHQQLEVAITYLNILDLKIAQAGVDNFDDNVAQPYLEKARDNLDSSDLERDSYYAFVADKCVSIYEFFGWFRYANQLKERIREINERS